ncbi:hypothetical protein GX50_05277 [[Emmonsia] crescens]|uniref:Uncharacterized protein n=1 Tax=[Emmonsia] crescens TaxID=73230 RepID=A0A2B7ZFH7_9EURO|nr:hypothetical protein GX50_05277 [Emmonsia crescens]
MGNERSEERTTALHQLKVALKEKIGRDQVLPSFWVSVRSQMYPNGRRWSLFWSWSPVPKWRGFAQNRQLNLVNQ